MRVLLCLLAFVSAPAWAEWVRVDGTNIANHYIDPTTIKKDGNLRRVWDLQDLKQRDEDGKMSIRTLVEYDCKEDRLRPLSFSTHSERMGGGNVLFTVDIDGKWAYIAPETVAATKLKVVCAK
jgi:hypothetical protein